MPFDYDTINLDSLVTGSDKLSALKRELISRLADGKSTHVMINGKRFKLVDVTLPKDFKKVDAK